MNINTGKELNTTIENEFFSFIHTSLKTVPSKDVPNTFNTFPDPDSWYLIHVRKDVIIEVTGMLNKELRGKVLQIHLSTGVAFNVLDPKFATPEFIENLGLM